MQETTTDQTTTATTAEKVEKTIYDSDLTQDQYETLRAGKKVEVEKAAVSVAEDKGESLATAAEEIEDPENEDLEGEEQEEEDEDKSKEKAPKKKKNGHQKRVDKLTARALAWEQRALAAEALAQANEQRRAEAAKPEAANKVATPGKPKPDDFATPAEFYEALADYKVEQRLQAEKLEAKKTEAKQAVAKIDQDHASKVTKFIQKNPDFHEVMEDVGPIDLSIAFQQSIKESEFGPEIMYELAKDRKELDRVNALGPAATARAIGRLEAKLEAQSKPAPKTETKITKAPPPVAPVTTRGNVGTAKSIYDKDLSQADYERLRAKQIKERQSSY